MFSNESNIIIKFIFNSLFLLHIENMMSDLLFPVMQTIESGTAKLSTVPQHWTMKMVETKGRTTPSQTSSAEMSCIGSRNKVNADRVTTNTEADKMHGYRQRSETEKNFKW